MPPAAPPRPLRRTPRRAVKPQNYSESLADDEFDAHLGLPLAAPKRRRRPLDKETETESLIALSLGFPIDSLLPSESAAAVVSSPSDVPPYIVVRNHILALWRANVRSWLSVPQLRETVSAAHDHLISAAHRFLSDHGYINFGVSPAIRSRLPRRHDKASVLIVGAGLAGLSAARHLLSYGFNVLVLEGRRRPGGRVFTLNMGNNAAAVDLGGSAITGIHANPLGVLARQLGIPLHKIRDRCPLYCPDGREVDQKLDLEVDTAFNKLLDQATQLREALGKSADGISLGSAIERLRQLFGVARSSDERELLDWHLANLEYANAGCLSDLSLAHWDQDDPYEMDGDHCFLAGGNWRLVNALCEDVPVLYEKTVTRIAYGDEGVEVVVAGGQVFQADMVLCTVPLGILKRGSIKFDPELPSRKRGAIERLGFGLLNKVAMVFPHVFWGEDLDSFGCLNKDRCKRGDFFLFYSYHTVSGGPVLIALVAGEAALAFEATDPVLLLHRALDVLRGIYNPRGVDVPDPIQSVCTKWGSDPLCYGSYSHVRVGSSGADYDILAESLGGRLFFAGEATNRQYPATMHGAFLSGLREASCILDAWRSKVISNNDPKKCLKKTLSLCSDTLLGLFKEPDIVSGNFSFVFDPFTTEDPKAMGLARVIFGKSESEACRKDSLDQKLEEHQQLSEPQLQHLHLYAILSREQALQIQLSVAAAVHVIVDLSRRGRIELDDLEEAMQEIVPVEEPPLDPRNLRRENDDMRLEVLRLRGQMDEMRGEVGEKEAFLDKAVLDLESERRDWSEREAAMKGRTAKLERTVAELQDKVSSLKSSKKLGTRRPDVSVKSEACVREQLEELQLESDRLKSFVSVEMPRAVQEARRMCASTILKHVLKVYPDADPWPMLDYEQVSDVELPAGLLRVFESDALLEQEESLEEEDGEEGREAPAAAEASHPVGV